MEKTVFRFSCKGRLVEEYTVTNFREEAKKSVRCYRVETGSFSDKFFAEEKESKTRKSVRSYIVEPNSLSERFLIENKGSRTDSEETKRSEATNVLAGSVANQNAFKLFFEKFAAIKNDEVAAYSSIKDFDRYFLVELRGCRPLNSDSFEKESFETKVLVLKNLCECISDIYSFRLHILGDKRKGCKFEFNEDVFYYSPLTKKVYLKDFDGIAFLKHREELEKGISRKNILNLKAFCIDCLIINSSYTQEVLKDMLKNKNDINELTEFFDMLGKSFKKNSSSINELVARFSKTSEETGFNPIINYLFVNYREEVKEEDIRLISDIEECLKNIYAAANINRLEILVEEANKKLSDLSSGFEDYKNYRTHSINVEYAKKKLEVDDLDELIEIAEKSYAGIEAVNFKLQKETDLHLIAYVSACLAESAWIVCLAHNKTLKKDSFRASDDGFKKLYYKDYDVKEYSEKAVNLYKKLYEEDSSIANARFLATAYRNRGVYLENYRIGGTPASKTAVKNMYLEAYDLMLKHGHALDNYRIFHCLISFNLKLIEKEYLNSINEAEVLLNENGIYLKEMASRNFDKTESYCLLKLMNDYYLYKFKADNEIINDLRKDALQYSVIAGDDKFNQLKIIDELKEIIK